MSSPFIFSAFSSNIAATCAHSAFDEVMGFQSSDLTRAACTGASLIISDMSRTNADTFDIILSVLPYPFSRAAGTVFSAKAAISSAVCTLQFPSRYSERRRFAVTRHKRPSRLLLFFSFTKASFIAAASRASCAPSSAADAER